MARPVPVHRQRDLDGADARAGDSPHGQYRPGNGEAADVHTEHTSSEKTARTPTTARSAELPVDQSAAGQDRDRFTESTVSPYLLYGAAFVGVGVAVGFVAIHNIGIRHEEAAVLLDSGGAAVGLLAVTLAAVALLLAFLTGPYKQIIEAVGVRKFLLAVCPRCGAQCRRRDYGVDSRARQRDWPGGCSSYVGWYCFGPFCGSCGRRCVSDLGVSLPCWRAPGRRGGEFRN